MKVIETKIIEGGLNCYTVQDGVEYAYVCGENPANALELAESFKIAGKLKKVPKEVKAELDAVASLAAINLDSVADKGAKDALKAIIDYLKVR